MLTNLDFLKVGQFFPPTSEQNRIDNYKANKALFEGRHVEVYADNLQRIERIIGNFSEVVSYPVVVNFQKLMTLKIADLLLGEPPQIISANQKAVDAIIKNSALLNTAYQTAIDVSRYGDGLFLIRKENDKGIIDITQPMIWYPVVNEDNIHEILYHVLAWRCEDKLKVCIHSKGEYDENEYKMIDGKIKSVVSSKTVKTGLSDFAVVQISNVMTSDRCFGIDDYNDIDSIVSDIMVRIGQIDRILDKHASPSMSGPLSALERSETTGEWKLKAGNYFPRDTKEDPDVNYIVWDGQLTANFTQIEKLINLLYTISEMGSALFGDLTSSTGNVPSGSALRRLMISPLSKVNRIRMRFDPALKKAIMLCSELGGKDITKLTDVSINWQDGLPPDDTETAAIIKSRTADKATMSQHRALKVYDNMTDADADEELARIQDEEASGLPPFSTTPESEPPDMTDEMTKEMQKPVEV